MRHKIKLYDKLDKIMKEKLNKIEEETSKEAEVTLNKIILEAEETQ